MSRNPKDAPLPAEKFKKSTSQTVAMTEIDGMEQDAILSRGHASKPKKLCNPGVCDCCQYIGEGDFLCDRHMETVLSDWKPTENYLMCKKEINGYE